MTDQCKHCIFRGDLKGCQSAECHKHDDWYSVQLNKRIAELEKELKNKESVILHMLQRDEAHNLSQQQLAVTRFANKYCGDCTTDYQVRLSTEAVMYCKYLEQPKEGE